MKFTLSLAFLFFSGATAFAPAAKTTQSTALHALNGWEPDGNKFTYGLPGAVAPFEKGFDPFGIAGREDVGTLKTFRESEVTHGRVAMLAVVGFLATEAPFNLHPLFNTAGKDIGPAIRHLDEVRAVSPAFFTVLSVAIGGFEILRATKGWTLGGFENLKADYYPGDIGFDPLGLKPTDPAVFEKMATKELNNGRLAMIGAAGFFAQELVNGEGILVNLGLAHDNFDPSTLPVVF